ncbi:Fe2+-dependent dioxygenase [Erythrobacter sp. Alg231-14]|uniref:Fe2+-dependent dioxygenase n=1 Tax=Erythrobacter sp. Alg231-14 TaxID=1922225 RepID=UPI000D56041D
MILKIAAVQDRDLLMKMRDGLSTLNWRDGRETAGAVARGVKRNEQAVMNDTAGAQMRDAIVPIISENPVVKAAARPRRISAPMIARTGPRGYYGAHVDNALMGTGDARLRSDISFTLFLSEPDEYDGGELVVHTAGMTQSIKGEAGELVLYPSTSIHEVRPVTRGSRVVCVGWIESLIRDPSQREMLFDLENLRATLRANLQTDAAELITLDKTIANLLRMWAQA